MAMLSANPSMSVEDFRWKNRLLVIFEEEGIDQKLFSAQLNEIKERKLIIMQFRDKSLSYCSDSIDVDVDSFLNLKLKSPKSDWLLVGLDGGIKYAGDSGDFQLEKIFRRIDSMPMRQSEILKNGKKLEK